MMATKIGKAMLGNELPATLNGLIVRVSLWLALFLSYFPSVFFFFSCYISSKGQQAGARRGGSARQSQRPPTEGDFLSAYVSTFTWV